MAIKSVKLSEEQFNFLKTSDNWFKTDDVPKEFWGNIPGIQRLHDTIAIMGSANCNDPMYLHGIKDIIAGIDVLTSESNPKFGEKEGNAYHYVIQHIKDDKFPYKIYGPYKTNMKVPHSFDCDDLENYWQE